MALLKRRSYRTARLSALGLCMMSLAACKSKKQPKAENLLRSDTTSMPATVVGAGNELHDVGETAAARDYRLKVLNVKACTVAPPFAPAPGIEKVGVEIELLGVTERQVPVNPFYAQLENSKGTRFEATLAGCQPGLEAQQITQGQTVRGWISFDLPAQHRRELTFTYSPVVIGVGREEVRFSLEG